MIFLVLLLFVFVMQDTSLFPIALLIGILYLMRKSGDNSGGAASQRIRDNLHDVFSQFDGSERQRRAPTFGYRTKATNKHAHNIFLSQEAEDDILFDDEPHYVHEAILAAGLDPANVGVLLVDLGLLVYNDDNDSPQIYQTTGIPDDAAYVRPFVELQLPKNIAGNIRFEILDSTGQSVFVDQANYTLPRGSHPIVASRWLPVENAQALDGIWQLKISAGETLLANHIFHWDQAPQHNSLRAHIQADGEISPELRAALAEQKLQRVSLDELLADFDDNEITNDAELRHQRR